MFRFCWALLPLFGQGAYSQIFQALAAREAAAQSGGMEIAYIAVLVSSMLWTAAGCALSNMSRADDVDSGMGGGLWMALLCSASGVSALASLGIFSLLPALSGYDGVVPPSQGRTLLVCAALPLLFSLVNGVAYGLMCRMEGRGGAGRVYAADALGSMLGGMLFSMLLARFLPPLALLSCLGGGLAVSGYLSYGMSSAGVSRKAVSALSCLAALALCILAVNGDRKLSERRWSAILPGSNYEGCAETAQGRVELVRRHDGALCIYRDMSLEASLPAELELECPGALFSIVQPGRDDVEALIVCPAFSGMPSALLSMPALKRLDMVCPDGMLVRTARSLGVLPPDMPRFKMVEAEPRRYMEDTSGKYDLILVIGFAPDTLGGNRLFTEEFYRSVSGRLRHRGAFITSMQSSGGYSGETTSAYNGMLVATLKRVFEKVAATPGGVKLFACGGVNVSADFDELDRRADALMPEGKPCPSGLLGVVYSQSRQRGEWGRISAASLAASVNTDISPSLPFYHLRVRARELSGDVSKPGLFQEALEWGFFRWREVASALLAIYVVSRYFLGNRVSRKAAFMSFENGFYAMGLVVALLFMHQSRCGALYRDIAAAGGVFIGGSALGALFAMRLPKGALWLKWVSAALPLMALLLPFAPWQLAYCGVFAWLFMGGVSVGAAYREFIGAIADRRGSALLWSAEICGGAAGAVLLMCFLMPSGGFIACAVLLSALRLPLALSKAPGL